MPYGDPRDGFFYPTLTLMIDFYIMGGVPILGFCLVLASDKDFFQFWVIKYIYFANR